MKISRHQFRPLNGHISMQIFGPKHVRSATFYASSPEPIIQR